MASALCSGSMRDTRRGSFPPNQLGSVAALPRRAGKLLPDRFNKLLKSWLRPMLDCPVSSSAPPHECVPKSILSPDLSGEKMFLDSPLENNDPELSGISESRRNADGALVSDVDDARKGDSPTISRFVERKGDDPITAPPMGPPLVDVILSNTASAIDEGRSPCALTALPVEMVLSPGPNLALSTFRGGGDWGINCSLDFPIGTNALPLPMFGWEGTFEEKARMAVPWVLRPPVECRRRRGSESGGIANRSLSSVENKKGRSSCRRDIPGGDTVAQRCLLAAPANGILS